MKRNSKRIKMGIYFTNIVITYLLIILNPTNSTLFDTLNEFYRTRSKNPEEGVIKDTETFEDEYDFVVIGAGSGGSVVANRLTEVPEWEVLLLEAGKDETFMSDIPLTSALNQITSLNWGYKTDKVPGACLGLKNQVCNWPRGRVLGGTSVLNYLVYTRGNKLDYDNWEVLGNKGWSYKDVLPYFIKSENVGVNRLKKSMYHGTSGYLNVEESPYTTKLFEPFKQAAAEMGYELNDPNGRRHIGFSKVVATMREGRRCSASRAFLEPIRDRKNFHVSKLTRVTKILINPDTKHAYGVIFIKNKRKHVVRVRKEIILSAGTIGSAHLLMLSGVGPRKNLEQFKIPVIQDSMVGYNLQDHVCFAGVLFLVNDTVTLDPGGITSPGPIIDYLFFRRGPLTLPGGAEGVVFMKSKYSSNQTDDYPDFELVMGPSALNRDSSGSVGELVGITEEFKQYMFHDIQDREAFAITPVILHPLSRGRISLRSGNPFHWPSLQPNYFQNKRDLFILREAAKAAVAITKTSGFRRLDARLHERNYPGCEHLDFDSDEHWECAIRQTTSTLSHIAGTVKMGPISDPTAVVDPTLKVIGVSGLRVVDASIMPVLPVGHPNAVIFMIGEKASDLIKMEWGVRPETLEYPFK